MLNDEWEGKNLADAEFRKLFTRENLLSSGWYAARLAAKQKVDKKLWHRHVEYLNQFLRKPSHEDVAENLGVGDRLNGARKFLVETESPEYLKKLSGTLGAEPVEAYLTK
jgi:phosphoenolpyruvate carboxykinase (diphosphate)